MIAKKYFSALIILITLLGFYKKQSPAPNQEIELQFADQTTVLAETDEVIEAITAQLEALGVENIQVRQTAGILKIAYYSDENVAEIKKILAEEGFESEDKSEEIPTNKKAVTFQEYGIVDSFKIDVYELQTVSNPYTAIHGKYILALHKDYDKSPSPNSSANTSSFLTGEIKTTIALAYTESSYTAIPKENISYEIPDVRAGPFTTMHS
ncbi:hypothetical protein H2O64_15535 [Kordia sp. YSTF-M3]|uniref:HMA domain-containing protein n=1 Tax=Kordia aestuariivivens TaxID=2759037 RepID=A0ABR7QBX5_9FLAO|nr:hypothetical protein [Kordia aestuariivivens]MBC8756089.1 hypothetical protein [Kordia aestuariivivens]